MPGVLTINSGSSSLRFALFNALESLSPTLIGKFDRIGLLNPRLSFTNLSANNSDERTIDAPDHVACVPVLVELLKKEAGVSAVSAIGHRVVHGGPHYCEPARVDGIMLEELRRHASSCAAILSEQSS